MRSMKSLFAAALVCGLSTMAMAQSSHILYDFTSADEGWSWKYNGSAIPVTGGGGNLTFQTAAGSIFPGFGDDADNIGAPMFGGASCTPLTGVDALEFDLGYTGADATLNVDFYIQGDSGFTYVSIGTHVLTAGAGVQTFSVPLTALTAAQRAQIRIIGFQVGSAQTAVANWTLAQVRATGTSASSRVLADFVPSAADGTIATDGACVNYNNPGVVGNDGGQNATGLSQTVPGGTDGVLQFQVQNSASDNPAVCIGNGYVAPVGDANSYLGRPIDTTGFTNLEIDIAASGTAGTDLTIIPWVQQTGAFAYNQFDAVANTLPRDGSFHTLSWDLTTGGGGPLPNPEFVQVLGFEVSEPILAESPVTIQVDEIRLVSNVSDVEDWRLY